MKENNSNRQQKDKKRYKSLEDWYKEIRYLKWPLIIFVLLVLILIVLLDLEVL